MAFRPDKLANFTISNFMYVCSLCKGKDLFHLKVNFDIFLSALKTKILRGTFSKQRMPMSIQPIIQNLQIFLRSIDTHDVFGADVLHTVAFAFRNTQTQSERRFAFRVNFDNFYRFFFCFAAAQAQMGFVSSGNSLCI